MPILEYSFGTLLTESTKIKLLSISPNPSSGLTSMVNSSPASFPLRDFSTIGNRFVSFPKKQICYQSLKNPLMEKKQGMN